MAVLRKRFPDITPSQIVDAHCLHAVRCLIEKGEKVPPHYLARMTDQQRRLASVAYRKAGLAAYAHADELKELIAQRIADQSTDISETLAPSTVWQSVVPLPTRFRV